MPYRVYRSKKDGKWVLASPTHVLGRHDSKSEALAQLRAVKANTKGEKHG